MITQHGMVLNQVSYSSRLPELDGNAEMLLLIVGTPLTIGSIGVLSFMCLHYAEYFENKSV